MSSHEFPDVLLVHVVVLILLPIDCGAIEKLVPHASVPNILLDLHIIVRKSWNPTSLPRKESNVPTIVKWNEKEEAINDNGELVCVSPHGWI